MKKKRFLFSLGLILFFHTSQAQLIMIDGETGEYKYEDVVTVSGVSQNQLINKASKWLELYYQNNDPIQIDSAQIKKIGFKKLHWKFIKKTIPLDIFIDVSIKVKNGKYKYEFSNFQMGKKVYGEIDATDLNIYIERFPEQYQIYIEEPIDAELTKAIASLEFFIRNGKLENDEDDW